MPNNMDASGRPLCEECKNPIPPYPNVPAGYVSPMSDKYIETTVAGVPGRENIAKIVCLDCYREDFSKKYPGIESPI